MQPNVSRCRHVEPVHRFSASAQTGMEPDAVAWMSRAASGMGFRFVPPYRRGHRRAAGRQVREENSLTTAARVKVVNCDFWQMGPCFGASCRRVRKGAADKLGSQIATSGSRPRARVQPELK